MLGKAKYYDGIKPVGIQVEYLSDGKYLHLTREGETSPFISLELSKLIKDHRQNTAMAIKHITSPEVIELIGDPVGLPPELIRKVEQAELKRLIPLMLLVIILLGGFWLLMPSLVKLIAKQISLQDEIRFAKTFNLDDIGTGEKCSMSAESLHSWDILQKRLWPLFEGEEFQKIDIVIKKSPIDNAFSMPGGKIILFDELIKKAESPEEIAGILAHEMAHTKERHVTQKFIRALAFYGLIHFLSGDLSSGLLLEPSTLLSIVSVSFDRDMEREADQKAMERLLKAGIDPSAMAKFFERSSKLPQSLALLSTHPADQERIKFFKEQALTDRRPLLTPEQWKSLKKSCL